MKRLSILDIVKLLIMIAAGICACVEVVNFRFFSAVAMLVVTGVQAFSPWEYMRPPRSYFTGKFDWDDENENI